MENIEYTPSRAFTKELVKAVIERSGGLKTFEANHRKLVTKRKVEGWQDLDQTLAFYAEHKADIFKVLADRCGEDSNMVAFVSDLTTLNNENYLNIDKVAEGMHNAESEPHADVALSICKYIVSEMAIWHSYFAVASAKQ